MLINIVNHVEQQVSVDQRVYWCESTLFKLADVILIGSNHSPTRSIVLVLFMRLFAFFQGQKGISLKILYIWVFYQDQKRQGWNTLIII